MAAIAVATVLLISPGMPVMMACISVIAADT